MNPPFLTKGDTIAIAASARKVSKAEMQHAISFLKNEGFNIVMAENVYGAHHQFAGNDDERANGLQILLNNNAVKAILFARGGYGTVRIIDKLNFNAFIKNPKWLIGFSDVTVIHSHVFNKYNIATLHAPMAINMQPHNINLSSVKSVLNILYGKTNCVNVNHNLYHINLKSASGKLTGGNLSVLYSLLGSDSDITTDDCILFLEDLDEYLYHTDRMIQALKRAGKFKKLKALLVGSFTKMHDNEIPFGFNYKEIICEAVKQYGYPVIFNVPSGHSEVNMPLIFGSDINININNNCIELIQL